MQIIHILLDARSRMTDIPRVLLYEALLPGFFECVSFESETTIVLVYVRNADEFQYSCAVPLRGVLGVGFKSRFSVWIFSLAEACPSPSSEMGKSWTIQLILRCVMAQTFVLASPPQGSVYDFQRCKTPKTLGCVSNPMSARCIHKSSGTKRSNQTEMGNVGDENIPATIRFRRVASLYVNVVVNRTTRIGILNMRRLW